MTSNGSLSEGPPPSKKALMQQPLVDLSGFRFDRVLDDRPEEKRVAVCGKILGRGDDEADAVVVIEKLPFAADKAWTLMTSTALHTYGMSDLEFPMSSEKVMGYCYAFSGKLQKYQTLCNL